MIVKSITEALIYDTDDGSQYVYIRANGDRDHKPADLESKQTQSIMQEIGDSKLWGDIRRAAQTNPTLQRALDEAVMIYNLSK